jgi:hypothetical protein
MRWKRTQQPGPTRDLGRGRRIGLVGCVKEKGGRPAAAKDLYRSALFRGRRRFVERTCDEWWILSALHGLVHPEQTLEPYDVTLKVMPAARRRRWAAGVLSAVDDRIGVGPGDVVELHCGAEYRDFGLADGLRERGAVIENPTEGMPIGKQLAYYGRSGRD